MFGTHPVTVSAQPVLMQPIHILNQEMTWYCSLKKAVRRMSRPCAGHAVGAGHMLRWGATTHESHGE